MILTLIIIAIIVIFALIWRIKTKNKPHRKKCMISQPMKGLKDWHINAMRNKAIMYANEHDYEILDNLFRMNPPMNTNPGLFYLAKSLRILASADVLIISHQCHGARGCDLEIKCAEAYGIPVEYYD